MHLRFLIIILLFSNLWAHAQDKKGFFVNPGSPYALNWRADAFMAPAGAGLFVGSIVLNKSKPSAIQGSYQLQDVAKFERRYVKAKHELPAKISDGFLYGSMALPGLLLIDKNIRQDKSFYIMYAEVLMLNGGATFFAKTLSNRPRPYVYSPDTDPASVTGKEPLRSFFSGHTSFTAASMYFMAKVYHDYHPHSPWRYVLWANAAVTPALTGFLRVRAGMHFPTDVTMGYIVGAATGFLVPYVHQKIKQNQLKEKNEQLEGF